MQQLFTVNNLIVAFDTEKGELVAVNGVSLSLRRGETLALVGESGCGKTVLCKSMLQILCEKGKIRQGEILFEGQNFAALSEKEMQKHRGTDIAMVFQDPMTSLDPMTCVGKQIMEVIQVHGRSGKKKEARSRAVELLRLVGIADAEKRFSQMPHQFSGGMRQRVAIAIALAGEPKLLLADEPTTSLDTKTQEQILSLIKALQIKLGIAMIFITHDLGLAARVADRAAIMRQGQIVESGEIGTAFAAPRHEYTKQLMRYMNYSRGTEHFHGKKDAKTERLISIKELKKVFMLDRKTAVKALDGVSMEIYRGEILGVVGPSGCGKSTLARCLMGMEEPDSGSIEYFGERVSAKHGKQMIFQDSSSAFNQRMTLRESIGEPLLVATGRNPKEEVLLALLAQVELAPEVLDRYPYEVSGGQRQRAAIARALSTDPEFIIADEPLSSLDVSIQAQIVHLFKKLQEQRGLTILLIAHDLPMVQHVSDRVVEIENSL